MKRRATVIAATGLGTAFLIGLGVWQLERLSWKEAILAQIDARQHAAPTALPPAADWPTLDPSAYEYRHVAVNGTYTSDTALVYRGGVSVAQGEGPGYLLLTPLRLPDDRIVIVNRGFVPLAQVDAARSNAPKTTVVVTGLMRSPETRNAFTPADEPTRGVWYTRDPASIAAQFHLPDVAPFTIDADPDPKATGWPRAGTTEVDIPNNHLSYAFTWFGLAAALVGVTVVFLRSDARA